MESSVDLLVPAAAARVAAWYGETRAAIDGMPPHITLLWPWLPAPVPADAIDRVRLAVRDVGRFTLRLGDVGRFPGVVFLAPEPRGHVDALIARLVAAFPDTPPYGGAFGSAPVPHLTVATNADERALDAIEGRLRDVADDPVVVDVDRIWISEERVGPGPRWAVRAEVSLGP